MYSHDDAHFKSVCVCVCVLRIVSRDRILRFKKTFLLLLLLPMLPSVCSAVQLHADSHLFVVSSVLKVDVNRFYIPMFSALEQTHVILRE